MFNFKFDLSSMQKGPGNRSTLAFQLPVHLEVIEFGQRVAPPWRHRYLFLALGQLRAGLVVKAGGNGRPKFKSNGLPKDARELDNLK